MTTLSFSTVFQAQASDVFRFHEHPENLLRISPPEFRLSILEADAPGPGGKVVLELRPLPMFNIRWTVRFTRYEPNNVIEDTMESGPFESWRHTRMFSETGYGTVFTEHIQYRLPYGALGRLIDRLFVRKRIIAMYGERHKEMKRVIDGAE